MNVEVLENWPSIHKRLVWKEGGVNRWWARWYQPVVVSSIELEGQRNTVEYESEWERGNTSWFVFKWACPCLSVHWRRAAPRVTISLWPPPQRRDWLPDPDLRKTLSHGAGATAPGQPSWRWSGAHKRGKGIWRALLAIPLGSWGLQMESPLPRVSLPVPSTDHTVHTFLSRARPSSLDMPALQLQEPVMSPHWPSGYIIGSPCHWVGQFALLVHPKSIFIVCLPKWRKVRVEQRWFGKLETHFVILWQTE